MKTVIADAAHKQLQALIDMADASGEPIRVSGSRRNAILVSEKTWNSSRETLHLLQIPGFGDSVRKGRRTPVAACATKPGW